MKKKDIETEEEVQGEKCECPKSKVGEIAETYGSGELNQLRDKINEIIRCQNS